MSISIYSNKYLLAVRWHELTADDIDKLVERARTMQRKEGRRLIYLGLQYDDTPLPGRVVTKHVVDRSAEFFACCESILIVLCATGLSATLHRTALRSMMTMARIARMPDVDRALVVDSLEAALAHTEAALPIPIPQLRTELAAAGMP